MPAEFETPVLRSVRYVMSANGRPNYVCGISTSSKLPTSMLTNEVILCLVRFGFGWNKLVQLLIRPRNSGGRIGRSLITGCLFSCMWPQELWIHNVTQS